MKKAKEVGNMVGFSFVTDETADYMVDNANGQEYKVIYSPLIWQVAKSSEDWWQTIEEIRSRFCKCDWGDLGDECRESVDKNYMQRNRCVVGAYNTEIGSVFVFVLFEQKEVVISFSYEKMDFYGRLKRGENIYKLGMRAG